MADVKISFVTIVLNGLPFLEFSLKAIYPFAHEIIIVEGAVKKARFAANPDGSSKDGTVEFIRNFPDPERKIRLIQGFWAEKDEMQDVALRYISGDYVWLVDSDEVYKRDHIIRIKQLLKENPDITQINFIPYNFWKGLDYIFVSSAFEQPRAHYRRVFKFREDARFVSHRPPTLLYTSSRTTADRIKVVTGFQTRQMGLEMFHYSYVLKDQVLQKIRLYSRYGWGKSWGIDLKKWYNECFLKWTPETREEIEKRWGIWTGDIHSHTKKFEGTHPEVMQEFVRKYGRTFYE